MAFPSLVMNVRRREPVLVAPTKLTPHEFKPLSDIDDQETMRLHIWVIHFFRRNQMIEGCDPVRVIREALAKALVFYYPLAGRLREGPGGKLIVECNGEGAEFVEADADVRLDQFGNPLRPPFPCRLEDLLHDSQGGILNTPVLLIQVTRLKCGGFIFAIRMNHTMADAAGIAQFTKAIGEMAQGADAPTVLPVWERTLLTARNPPHVTHAHPEYDEMEPADPEGTSGDMVKRSFFFGPREMAALRRRVPPRLRTGTRFEVLTGCVWRSCVIALGYKPEEEVVLLFSVNTRGKFSNPTLPHGYYGNGSAFPVARSTAGKLRKNPLGYAVELVRKAKASITNGYMQSLADLVVLRGRPPSRLARLCAVSDVSRAGFDEVDFGWGMPVYGGPVLGAAGANPEVGSFYTRCRNSEGEEGTLVQMGLPAQVMERFVMEIELLIKEPIGEDEPYCTATIPLVLSAL